MLKTSSALERIFRPAEGDLPRDLASYLLTLDFSPADYVRYEELSQRAQEADLSRDEERELHDLLTANDVLTILQSKARSSLKRQNPAA